MLRDRQEDDEYILVLRALEPVDAKLDEEAEQDILLANNIRGSGTMDDAFIVDDDDDVLQTVRATELDDTTDDTAKDESASDPDEKSEFRFVFLIGAFTNYLFQAMLHPTRALLSRTRLLLNQSRSLRASRDPENAHIPLTKRKHMTGIRMPRFHITRRNQFCSQSASLLTAHRRNLLHFHNLQFNL